MFCPQLSCPEFLCADESECIYSNKVCDGVKDCFDGSDEGRHCGPSSYEGINFDGILPSGVDRICESGYAFNIVTKKCQVRKIGKHIFDIFSHPLFHHQDINECVTFGTCTQGCVNTNGSFYCTCENNFILKHDNQTCIALERDAVLHFSTAKSINRVHLTSHSKETIQKTKEAIGLTYDGKSIFWTDFTNGQESIIKSTKGEQEILVTEGLETPESLAIDWLTGNIYFSDAYFRHIAVCTNSGHYCTQLVSADAIEKPRSIALHPAKSLMFWTDWGQSAHIGVAFMDGSDAKILVGNLGWPNGVTLDWPNDRLYWVDAKRQTIESVTVKGNDRRVILADVIKHPFAIAVFEDKLYWSDWDKLNIESCNKFTGQDLESLVEGEFIYGKLC